MKKVKRVSIWCLLLAFVAGGVFTFAPMPPLLALLGKAAIGVLTVVIFLRFTRDIPMAGYRAKTLMFHLILLPGSLMTQRTGTGRPARAACFCGSWSLLPVCNLTSLLYICIIPLSYTSV